MEKCPCGGTGMIPAWASENGRIRFCNCKLSPEIEKAIDTLIGEHDDGPRLSSPPATKTKGGA